MHEIQKAMRSAQVDSDVSVTAVLDRTRIVFLDHLRAIACLLVVLGHVYLVGFNIYEPITPYVPGVTKHIFGEEAFVKNVFTAPAVFLGGNFRVNVGILGVGIFFLISGFVILRAVERESTPSFLIRRFFRIFPVCLAAVALVAGLTAAYCAITQTSSPHTLISVLASGFVLNGYLEQFGTVPVLWTLQVELLFYLLMAGLAHARLLEQRHLLAASFICLLFTLAANFALKKLHPSFGHLLGQLNFSAIQITFLLVGCQFYRFSAKAKLKSVLYIGLAFFLYVVTRRSYLLILRADEGGIDWPNAVAAVLIFSLAFWSGMQWRWAKLLRWIADISYPLYLVHLPVGWIVLALMGSHGYDMLSSGLAAGVVMLLLAWALHVGVEKWALSTGRRLTQSSRQAGHSGSPSGDSAAQMAK